MIDPIADLTDYLNRVYSRDPKAIPHAERIRLENELARVTLIASYLGFSIHRNMEGLIVIERKEYHR